MSHFKLKNFLRYFGYTFKPSSGIQEFVMSTTLRCIVDIHPQEMLCYVRFEDENRTTEAVKYQDLFGANFELTESPVKGYMCFRCQFHASNYSEGMDLVHFLQSDVVDGFIVEGESYAYHSLVLLERQRETHQSADLTLSNRIAAFQ